MKKVLKINLAAVLALFMAFGFMSFELSTNNALQLTWYPVNHLTGAIDRDNPIANPGGAGEDCVAPLDEEVCAVEIESSSMFTNISQVPNEYTRASKID